MLYQIFINTSYYISTITRYVYLRELQVMQVQQALFNDLRIQYMVTSCIIHYMVIGSNYQLLVISYTVYYLDTRLVRSHN